ncbi:DgyrCDS6390 [Dimorphilus gyrociliatus]|uniref:DgyrCDS6390 n=1 Tax=Dimorphilus gyrociliatus TaxID=2664684 RepID=A0A7I8VMX6_9ANNE|nr:DgyrCDS6390 [Dimorphilus gyrociliatus]
MAYVNYPRKVCHENIDNDHDNDLDDITFDGPSIVQMNPTLFEEQEFSYPETKHADIYDSVEREAMREYLTHGLEKSITIYHAKVIQRSYGREKRFFCPPPYVRYRDLARWDDNERQICAYIGVNLSIDDMHHMEKKEDGIFFLEKPLFITSSDKRKNFELKIRLFYSDGSAIGIFSSKCIRVVTKPSKKRLKTPKNHDLCIESGSEIALFNRLRSQSVSTRYLKVYEDPVDKSLNFVASPVKWGSFKIHLVNEEEEESEEFDVEEGFIHYGQTVKLVCSETGMSLPRLIIRKVDKQKIILDATGPISQLHKCALYMKDTDRMYICTAQDKIVQFQANPYPQNPNWEMINDGSAWTVISTVSSEYKFYEGMGSTRHPPTPIPIVFPLECGGKGNSLLEINGERFTPKLKVWFDDYECSTFFRCEELLLCLVPHISSLKPEWKFVRKPYKVRLSLVRSDGIIYPTGLSFTYLPEPGLKTWKMSSKKDYWKVMEEEALRCGPFPYNYLYEYRKDNKAIERVIIKMLNVDLFDLDDIKVVLDKMEMLNYSANVENSTEETQSYPVEDIIKDCNKNTSISVTSCQSNHQLFKTNLWEEIRCNVFHEIASYSNQENISTRRIHISPF